MLVLTRKKSQVVKIGDDIEVMVTRIENGKVRLGIKAPPDVKIYRKEVADDIERNGPRVTEPAA